MVTLNKPSAGDTDWATEINDNWTDIETEMNGARSVATGGTGTTTPFTQGSVAFAGASGVYSQDNSNLFWDDTNNELGIGTNLPAGVLHAVGQSYFQTSSSGAATTNVFFRNIGTGAVGGGAGLAIQARDSVQSNTSIVALEGTITDITNGSEKGKVWIRCLDGGTLREVYSMDENTDTHSWKSNGTERMRLTTAGLRIEPDGIAGAPSYALHVVDDTTMPMYVQRSASGSLTIAEFNNRNSPGAAATGIHFDFYFLDSVGSATRFNYLEFLTLDVTNGSEDGRTRLFQQVGGTESAILDIQSDNLGFNGASFGSGQGVMFAADAATNPSSNPSGGGILYSDSGAGKWRGSSGTTTTFGPADPHCPRCKRDFAFAWENERYGKLSLCGWCLSEELEKLEADVIIQKEEAVAEGGGHAKAVASRKKAAAKARKRKKK